MGEIEEKTGNAKLDLITCDLASQEAIRSLSLAYRAKYERLDVLVNNAGVYLKKRSLTQEGIEMTFGVNYIAHFLLTHLMLDLLQNSPSARVINTTSRIGQANGSINFDDINFEKGYKGRVAYYQSKLAIVMTTIDWTEKLAERGITNVAVNAYCPGFVRTDIIRDNKLPRYMFKVFGFLMQSPAQGAATAIHLAYAEEVERVSGKTFSKKKTWEPSPQSRDAESRKNLWNLSEKIADIHF